jgi:hypothetical protein
VICPPRLRQRYTQSLQRMQQGDPDGLLGQRLRCMAQRADGSELPVEMVMWMTAWAARPTSPRRSTT